LRVAGGKVTQLNSGGIVGRKYTGLSVWLLGLTTASITSLGLSVACAQTNPPQITRFASSQAAAATSGSGQYYFEFRSRQAWDYGHTFVVFGRVGEPPSKKNVAGLSPKGDDPQMWLMGHYVPVGYGLDRRRPRGQIHHLALPRPSQQGAVRQNRRFYPPAAG